MGFGDWLPLQPLIANPSAHHASDRAVVRRLSWGTHPLFAVLFGSPAEEAEAALVGDAAFSALLARALECLLVPTTSRSLGDRLLAVYLALTRRFRADDDDLLNCWRMYVSVTAPVLSPEERAAVEWVLQTQGWLWMMATPFVIAILSLCVVPALGHSALTAFSVAGLSGGLVTGGSVYAYLRKRAARTRFAGASVQQEVLLMLLCGALLGAAAGFAVARSAR